MECDGSRCQSFGVRSLAQACNGVQEARLGSDVKRYRSENRLELKKKIEEKKNTRYW